jgi:nitrilase
MTLLAQSARQQVLTTRYTAPTADARDTWLPTMQHIAQEGRCFVISGASPLTPIRQADGLVNQFQTSQDFPADYPPLQQEGKQWSKGGSCIISPLGQILAGPLWEKEGIITADVGSLSAC